VVDEFQAKTHHRDTENTEVAQRNQYVATFCAKPSGHFTRLIGDSSFCDFLDLFKFRFFKAKKSCHTGDLIRTYEVRGLRAESLYTWSKLAALHCFRDVQANAADACLGAKQAEVTNNHFTSLLTLICSLTTLRMSMHHSPYAIGE